MGIALDRLLDLAAITGGDWKWSRHAKAAGVYEIELRLPDRDPLDGAGASIDLAALDLLLAYFPEQFEHDAILQACAGEHAHP